MRYNFDLPVDRTGTYAIKQDNPWPGMKRKDVLQMWVADMDLPCPDEVVAAVKKRAEHPIYGYSYCPDSVREVIVERVKRHFGWQIKPEWLVFTAGVVNGVRTAVQAFTHTGDEVVIQTPVYYPFFTCITSNGCQIVENPLKFDGARYEMDLDGLSKLLKPETTFPVRQSRIRELILCNPHNPTGRVWSAEALRELGQLCAERNCLIIADEIHADLMIGSSKHTCIASLSPEFEQNSITLMAASKSFNIAGLQTSFAVIPNDKLRARYLETNRGGGSAFGFAAIEAAYRYGDDYLSELNAYLTGNVEYLTDYISKHVPGVKVIKPEGTYLMWLDFRALGLDVEALHNLMFSAGLAFDEGYIFGTGGAGFQRINIGCPRSTVVECCHRLEEAVASLKK